MMDTELQQRFNRALDLIARMNEDWWRTQHCMRPDCSICPPLVKLGQEVEQFLKENGR